MNQHLQFFRATFRRNCNYFFQKLSNSPKPEMHFVLQVTASNVKDGHNYSAIWCLKGAFSSSLSLTCKVGSCHVMIVELHAIQQEKVLLTIK